MFTRFIRTDLLLLLLGAISASIETTTEIPILDSTTVYSDTTTTYLDDWENWDGIVPDLLDSLPNGVLNVEYDDGVKVDLGNELTIKQVQNFPQISWEAEPNQLYTLVMTDIDVPSRREPTRREALHCLIGNIPGKNISAGEVITEFIPSGPRPDTGLHRYVFLVFKQPAKLTFDEKRITNLKLETQSQRIGFNTREFSKKYNLGGPITGNYYQAQYDDYVLILTEKIFGKQSG